MSPNTSAVTCGRIYMRKMDCIKRVICANITFPTDLLFPCCLRALLSVEDIIHMQSLRDVNSTALAGFFLNIYFSARPLTFHWYSSLVGHNCPFIAVVL